MSGNVQAIGDRHILLPDGTKWQIPPHPLSGRIQPAEQLIPRVCIIPTYAYSSGPEAIEIAASAGLMLDPWEQLSLILGLGETAAGKWAAYIVALIVARQNGKGADLEALVLYWLFATDEELIGHTAHEYRTAMEAFRRVVALITNTDWMRKKVKKVINTNGEEGIELLTGQRLRFLARSKGAGRGFTFRKLIWDEAYALTPTHQEAQLPTLSAVLNAQIWLTSSPPLTSDTGEPMFLLQRNAPKSKDVAFMDYGAEGNLDALDDVPLDDETLWIRTNPNAPERISLETMRRERIAMGDRGFARERLGIWPPDITEGYGVISKEQWDLLEDPLSGMDEWPVEATELPNVATALQAIQGLAMGDPPTKLIGRPCISVDVTPRNSGQVKSSISLAQRRKDGIRHLELVKVGSGSHWVVPDLVKLVLSVNARIAIDPGSPAGSLLADLQEAIRKVDLIPDDVILTMSSRDVAQAFGMIYDAATSATLEFRTVAHLGQPEVDAAIGGADTRYVGDGQAWDRKAATTDITPAVSITNALWGLAKMGTDADPEPMVMWA